MKITVFVSGYVGLVQSAVLADAGHHVVCVDTDANRIQQLEEGHIPIYEPGLESIVRTTLLENRLKFTSDSESGIQHGEIIFIAVGTPPTKMAALI